MLGDNLDVMDTSYAIHAEQRIAVIGGTSGIGFTVESKGLHSSAWRVGQAGDAY